MIQPGPDEISQGMNRRRSPVAEKLISFGHAQRTRLRRLGPSLHGPRALTAAGAAAVLVIGAVTTAVVVSRPSYPHAWCRPLLTELHVQGESDPGYAAALVRLRRRDHAPVGELLSDLDDYTVARSVVPNQADLTPSGSVAGMASTFTAVTGDLRAPNRRCDQPPGAYEGDSF
ncbi:MAG: hypothetical protein M3Y33_00815 [Actinomycetota bacterium]|nr:hypothetical protein [Actinomycetota bacterium]